MVLLVIALLLLTTVAGGFVTFKACDWAWNKGFDAGWAAANEPEDDDGDEGDEDDDFVPIMGDLHANSVTTDFN